jgi:Ankyrin repeat.
MTSPLDIPELYTLIIANLDPKTICRMMSVDRFTHQLITGMSIYRELMSCLEHVKKGNYKQEYTFKEKIFAYACYNGCWNVIHNILRDEDMRNVLNESLIMASANGQLEVVKYLVEKGADIHSNNDEALLLAFVYGHLVVTNYLVKKGVDFSFVLSILLLFISRIQQS